MYIHFVLITYFLIADFLLIPGLQPAPCIAGENSPTVLTSLLNCVQVLKKVLLETIGNTWHSMHWQVSSRLLPWKSECFICQTGEVSILLVQSTEYQIPLVINPNPDLIWSHGDALCWQIYLFVYYRIWKVLKYCDSLNTEQFS